MPLDLNSGPSLAVRNDGLLCLAYRNPSDNEIYYREKTNGGWTQPINISNTPETVSRSPSVTMVNNKAAIVWVEQTSPGGDGDVLIDYMPFGLNNYNLSNSPLWNSDYPVLADIGGNRFAALWQEGIVPTNGHNYRLQILLFGKSDGYWSSLPISRNYPAYFPQAVGVSGANTLYFVSSHYQDSYEGTYGLVNEYEVGLPRPRVNTGVPQDLSFWPKNPDIYIPCGFPFYPLSDKGYRGPISETRVLRGSRGPCENRGKPL